MIYRLLVLLGLGISACGQVLDPASAALNRAYESLRTRAYGEAIAAFQQAIEQAPQRATIRKDLAYTYLKIGENELARDQFRAAMEMDPSDDPVAMEFAFLAYENKEQAAARRVFDRIRQGGGPSAATAETAFQNIDRPLVAGIERWSKAIEMGGDNFSAHFELATLAEQRDELVLAAEHYEKAWRLLPDRRSVLVDLGRVWKELQRSDDATAALLAASRGGEARAAEMARFLLPDRYPFVAEFQAALRLDPRNYDLRRELGYLLLRMERETEAEDQFRVIVEQAPDDLLSATQLGFLLHARGEEEAAQKLFDRVLAGPDEELANRVRAVLRIPQVLRARSELQSPAEDARVMAERSAQAGYLKDALKYLQVAHEADPGDFGVMLKLGWTLNLLHDDQQAIRWFDLARRSPDPQVASESALAWNNLRTSNRLLRLSVWLYPILSSRWRDAFGYGQLRAELRRTGVLAPYLSLRFIGDRRFAREQGAGPSLSESSFVFAAGVRTAPWRHMIGWFEAGTAFSYVSRHMLPDYRGGISGQWQKVPERSGWFIDTTADALYVSRFNKDYLLYTQSRTGYAAGKRAQFYWNANFTADVRREYWANFVETGPGIRLAGTPLPPGMWVSLNLMRGAFLVNDFNPRRPNYTDIRLGVWYGLSTR